MQSKFLKSTTAIVLALAVAAPAPILAQDAPTEEELQKQLEQAAEEGTTEAVTDETLPAETEAEVDAATTENTETTTRGTRCARFYTYVSCTDIGA